VAQEQCILLVSLFSLVDIIPLMLYTYIYPQVAMKSVTKEGRPVNFQMQVIMKKCIEKKFKFLSFIQALVHTNHYLHVTLIRRANERSLGIFRKGRIFGNRGAMDIKVLSDVLFFVLKRFVS
jgi:hypothetical protein